jgi:hypothetical protein
LLNPEELRGTVYNNEAMNNTTMFLQAILFAFRHSGMTAENANELFHSATELSRSRFFLESRGEPWL